MVASAISPDGTVRQESAIPASHHASSATSGPVLAAGAVVLRPSSTARAGLEVLVVHRPRYDDWSLPKGHRDPGEYLPVTAVREVFEETGVRIRLGAPLTPSRYPVNGRPKEVSWWLGVPLGEQAEPPDDEADAVQWVPTEVAAGLLTFEADRHLVQEAARLRPATPFLLIRHGKALSRAKWGDAELLRPLTEGGLAQARGLVPLLEAFGVERVDSSQATRCVDTVAGYGARVGLEVHRHEELNEGAAAEAPDRASALTRDLALRAASEGRPGAVCGHRPVLPLMLRAVGLPDRPLGTADCVVAHLAEDGLAVAEDHVESSSENL